MPVLICGKGFDIDGAASTSLPVSIEARDPAPYGFHAIVDYVPRLQFSDDAGRGAMRFRDSEDGPPDRKILIELPRDLQYVPGLDQKQDTGLLLKCKRFVMRDTRAHLQHTAYNIGLQLALDRLIAAPDIPSEA
jgi:hypothetical protein